MFYRLLELAKENSAESRGALMLGLADILVKNIALRSDEELHMFGEVALLLYKTTPKHDRAKLSRKVSLEQRTPVNLALELASDAIAIAMPVLENYPSFDTKNLLKLAEELDDEHLQVIARRKDLDPSVSDTLVRRGTKIVHRILAGNREIRLSHIALLALVRHAVQDVVLREDLALRSDLTPAVCNMLMPQVDGVIRKRLQKLVQGALTKTDLDRLARLRGLRRTHGAEIDRLNGRDLWTFAQSREISFNELVVLMLQDDRLGHVADLMGLRARIAPSHARDAIFKGKMADVVAMAQETELSIDTFSLLAKARCRHLRIPASQAAEWINAYVVANAKNANAGTESRIRRGGSGEFAVKRPPRPRRTVNRRLSAI